MSNEYNHGVRVIEKPTSLNIPLKGTSGLQVIIGTAPVHTRSNYKELVNRPIMVNDYDEAVEKLGYSEDWEKYTLCQSMYANFKIYPISPVVFINVLDPDRDVEVVEPVTWNCENEKEYIFDNSDIVENSISVKKDSEDLVQDTDYVLTVDDSGYITVSLLSSSEHYGVNTLTINAKKIVCNSSDMRGRVVGGYSVDEGKNTGISCVNDVFPMYQLVPGLILAPGWSQYPEVSTALQAAAVNINGEFYANAVIDIDCSKDGAVRCYDFREQKESQYVVNENSIAVWPKVKSAGKIFYYSAIYAAAVAYMDANNEDMPNLSPSNKSAIISATVLENGDEIQIDKRNANNYVNAYGGVTAINYGGWKIWGNNTAAFPENRDPKDRWICARRFFNYYRNRLIQTVAKRGDELGNFRLIEAICDDENVWFNAVSSKLYIAGGTVSYLEEDNTIDNIMEGSIRFRVKLATYLPAEDIAFEIEFDPSILQKALEA